MTATFKRMPGTFNAMAAVLLAAISASATAEVWVEASQNNDYVAYGDPSSIRREGDIVKMWSMFDYKNPQPGIAGKPYLSTKRQFEYDCKQGRARALAVSSYAAHDGKGVALASASVKYDWSPVVPESADEYLLKFACKKYDAANNPRGEAKSPNYRSKPAPK
jgi:hypothetical protein